MSVSIVDAASYNELMAPYMQDDEDAISRPFQPDLPDEPEDEAGNFSALVDPTLGDAAAPVLQRRRSGRACTQVDLINYDGYKGNYISTKPADELARKRHCFGKRLSVAEEQAVAEHRKEVKKYKKECAAAKVVTFKLRGVNHVATGDPLLALLAVAETTKTAD